MQTFYIQFKKQEREGWYTVSKTVICFMIIFKYEPEENKQRECKDTVENNLLGFKKLLESDIRKDSIYQAILLNKHCN